MLLIRKMFLIRKYFKKYIYLIILFVFGTVAVIHILLSEPKEYQDNKYKIAVIEELIHSNTNDVECNIPNLPIDNPEIMKFYTKNHDIINCGNPNDDWVQCNKSICSVKESVILEKGNIVCLYTDVLRTNDYDTHYGKTTKTKDIYVLKESDFVLVNCKSQKLERWLGLAIGIREKLDRKLKNTNNLKLYNVLMFGFDSLSHNAFIRKLPKTYEYLTKTLNTNVLNGYNIVGDGTPQALIPILTGYNELELPETRKRISGSGYVDLYPMIWKYYEKFGYVTSYNEDSPNFGTFTYRLNGFNKQPTDHYMHTLYVEVENYINTYANKYCIGNMAGHKVMLDYTKNFMMKYNNTPSFIFSFHGDLSHDSINLIGNADNDVLKWLKDLNDQKILENTILIMMSDHGHRFADVRNTVQGKQEERLPFFSFTFPNSFKRQYPKLYEHFLKNLNRLTTPYDINETLLDLLRIQNLNLPSTIPKSKHQFNNPPRAMSLFRSIPKNRSCSMAYIEPHWCSCLQWKNINNTETTFIKKLANSVVYAINDYTKDYRNICENLYLSEIKWVMELKPNDKLISFKQNKDFDGFLADMSAQMHINMELYQVKIIVLPGHSIFEASVSYDLIERQFNVKMSQISRINKYGSQANCIYDTYPDLRKYCFCKNQTKNPS